VRLSASLQLPHRDGRRPSAVQPGERMEGIAGEQLLYAFAGEQLS